MPADLRKALDSSSTARAHLPITLAALESLRWKSC